MNAAFWRIVREMSDQAHAERNSFEYGSPMWHFHNGRLAAYSFVASHAEEIAAREEADR